MNTWCTFLNAWIYVYVIKESGMYGWGGDYLRFILNRVICIQLDDSCNPTWFYAQITLFADFQILSLLFPFWYHISIHQLDISLRFEDYFDHNEWFYGIRLHDLIHYSKWLFWNLDMPGVPFLLCFRFLFRAYWLISIPKCSDRIFATSFIKRLFFAFLDFFRW